MIKQSLARVKKALLGRCEHAREDRSFRTIASRVIVVDGADEFVKQYCCMACGEDLPEPTKVFRTYIRLRQHIKLRVGTVRNRKDGMMRDLEDDEDNKPGYCVGLRYVVPGSTKATRRVWLSFDDKAAQKSFAGQMNRRMMLCTDDEGYNEVINEALDLVRDANPDIPEQVMERGDSEDDEA